MSATPTLPTPWLILFRDPLARYMGLFPLAMLLFGVILPIAYADWLLLAPGAGLLLVGLWAVGRRVGGLRALLARGTSVPGEIVASTYERGVTYLTYTYAYGERRYRESNFRMGQAPGLGAGTAVNVVLDPHAPQHSLVLELYAP